VQLRPLVTHIAPPEQASDLFLLMDQQPADVVQAVIDFGQAGSVRGREEGKA
jgi:hypothetical protein